MNNRGLVKTVVFAGLIAGILDGAAAVILFLMRGGKDPVKIFNFIASGIFGADGLNGGMSMAWLGLFFHLCIATIWAIIYFIAYPRVTILARNWAASGLGYGVFVWLGMNLVVVPLSNTPPMAKTFSGVLIGTAVLMVCIGLPISYFASKFYARQGQP